MRLLGPDNFIFHFEGILEINKSPSNWVICPIPQCHRGSSLFSKGMTGLTLSSSQELALPPP
jgi:hypothetical protein